MRHIYIDADSANNIGKIESVARKYHIPVTLYCNGDHQHSSEYSEVKFVEKGKDVADFAIVSQCNPGDIVITRDYGLAAMVLTKKAVCMHPNGSEYTEGNIELLLLKRNCGKQYGIKGRKGFSKVGSLVGQGIVNLLEEKLTDVAVG